MHYDEAGCLKELDYQSWFNDEWRTSRKETFTYEDGLLTEKLTLERVANRLEKRGREVYAYDDEGRLQSINLLGWSYEQKWEPIFKYSYAYDVAGQEVQDRKEILDQDLARGEYTVRYEYEDDGNLDSTINMREQGGEWVVQQRLDYRYNAEGEQVERAYQATRTEGASWTDMIKIRYEYGEDGRRSTATTQGRGRTDGFEETSRRLYEYDAHGNLTSPRRSSSPSARTPGRIASKKPIRTSASPVSEARQQGTTDNQQPTTETQHPCYIPAHQLRAFFSGSTSGLLP